MYVSRFIFTALGLCALFCAGNISADDGDRQPVQPDPERIRGTWQVTSLEMDGMRASAEDVRKLKIVNGDDGAWSARSEGNEIARGSSTFNQGKSPREIDLTVVDDNGQEQTYRGIYELDDKTRRLCIAPPDFPRPSDFTSFPGTKRILVTLERVAGE